MDPIVHRDGARPQRDLAVGVEASVRIMINSLGAWHEVNDAIHAYGGLVLHDATDDRVARNAVVEGAEGLVAFGGRCRRPCRPSHRSP